MWRVNLSVMIDAAKYSDINLSHFMSDLIRFLVKLVFLYFGVK